MHYNTRTLEVSAPPAYLSTIFDDVRRTPQWLARCTAIDKLDDAPNRVGTRLTYHYWDGRRTGKMDGEITARELGERASAVRIGWPPIGRVEG